VFKYIEQKYKDSKYYIQKCDKNQIRIIICKNNEGERIKNSIKGAENVENQYKIEAD